MNKTAKNILIAAGAAALGSAVAATVHHSTAKNLMKVALDRDPPKKMMNKKHLEGEDRLSEIKNVMLEAATKLQNCGAEVVEIRGVDGVALLGHYYRKENAKRIIIAMHGWRSSWARDFGVIAPFWHDNDCSVLYAEQRGQGGSGGEYMGFGLLERYDCLNWINWVNERTGGSLPIYLGGVSMGAATILMTAGLELPENVCGIVADCGFTSPHAIWKHVLENNLHIPYRLYGSIASDMCRKKIQMGSEDYSSVDAMKVCKVPVLFIHGTDDHFVPIEMTYENYKACASPKRLFIVPGAEHGMSYLVDKEGYEAAVRNFWREFDKIKSPVR